MAISKTIIERYFIVKGKTHLAFGIGTGCILSATILPENIVMGGVCVAVTALGSLAPDIDSPTSTISKKARVTSKILSKIFGHRNFFHSPLCSIILSLLVAGGCSFLSFKDVMFVPLAFFVGYIGHIFLDSLTKGGVPLLMPFTSKKIHFTNIRTGGIGEKLLFVFASALTLCCIVGVYLVQTMGIETLKMYIFGH